MARTVLHLSPHPDDEIAGMPATLMALRDAGWRVVNVACGLGRPAQHQRRRGRGGGGLPARRLRPGDVRSAAARSRPATTSRAPRRRSSTLLGQLLRRARVPRSCARRRRTTGITPTSSSAAPRAARSRRTRARAPPLWLWGVWADLPFPTLIAPFDRARLARDPARARRARLRARATAARPACSRRARCSTPASARSACTARASTGDPAVELAELLCEVVLTPAGWQLGAPRRFDADAPLASPSARPIGWWLDGGVAARAPAARSRRRLSVQSAGTAV